MRIMKEARTQNTRHATESSFWKKANRKSREIRCMMASRQVSYERLKYGRYSGHRKATAIKIKKMIIVTTLA